MKQHRPVHWPALKSSALLLGIISAAPIASAHEDHIPDMEEVIVYGRAQEQIGISNSASSGLVGFDDIALPPLLRVGELVESVPGMVATQHSGTGKANQYFLRGFNLDHGTDFSAKVDGIPVNMRTHGHGQGYLDLNFLIPELVQTTRYQKGPYSARTGDFSSAGNVEFSYYHALPDNLLEVTYGDYGFTRGLVGGSIKVGNGQLSAVLDTTRYDGPWALEENLKQDKLFLGYNHNGEYLETNIRVMGYRSEWDATDQIPQRAVESGLIDELGFIDPDLGGDTHRYSLSASVEAEKWSLNAYALDYDFTLYSDFTYFLDDPTNGDEFEQRDSRRIYGAEYLGHHELNTTLPVTLSWGGELRHDDIGELALNRTAARQIISTTRSDSVDETSIGAFAEASILWNDRLRTVIGLRADSYHWDVNALRPENSGTGNDQQVSPKFTLAYRFHENWEGYLNYGRGMHSNDVRGTTISVDPASGTPVDRVPALVATDGAEVGIRFERDKSLNFTAVAFWLDVDSELVFVGDAGGTEANDGSERTGLELNAFWNPADTVALNASYTYTDAEYQDVAAGFENIPGAIESTLTLGLTSRWTEKFSTSVRYRYLGEAPLIEDGSVTTDPSSVFNVGAIYVTGPYELRLDVFNLFDSNDKDITYYYESQLASETSPVEDYHYHPLEPRSIRASFKYAW